MAETTVRPIQGVTIAEAAEILGLVDTNVARLARKVRLHRPARWMRRGLDRSEVEALALQRRRSGDGYWLSSSEPTEILSVSPTRVKQPARAGRLPVVRDGRYYRFRRHQVEVIANAREAPSLGG